MTTAVGIASNALLMLGDKPIADFTESSDRARIAANLWPSVRDSVLRSHPWNCAIKRESLLPDTGAPAFDWSYQFTLPGDCLRVLSVGEIGADEEFKIEGRKLLMDASPCDLRYVFQNDNPDTYDPMLVDLLTVTMAHRMCYAITQSATLTQEIGDRVDRLARKARAVDGQDDTQDAWSDSPLMAARYRV
jgi:hypothetical protein